MAIPPITALPTPPSRGSAPATFVADADAFFDALPTFVTELNAAGDEIDTAVASASSSSAIAIAAATATTVATSTTSVAIGTGSKAFTTQAGKNWIVGTWLVIASAADPSNRMTGQVTAYSGTSLTVDVEASNGTGSFADWNIGLSGSLGVTGAAGQDGNGAWTTFETEATTSGSSVTFGPIAGTYSDLRFEFIGVSISTTANISIEVSDNGTNWSTAGTLQLSAGASDVFYGDVRIADYARGVGSIDQAVANLASSREIGGFTESSASYRLPGPLTHVRFSVSAGNFDAGSIVGRGRQQV